MKCVGVWPVEEQEGLDSCPVCRCQQRVLIYSDLEDVVFKKAPGVWNLYKCGKCGCAYLDPRPTADSIWRAYLNYYTHGRDYGRSGLVEKLRNEYCRGLLDGASAMGTPGYWLYRYVLPSSIRADAEYQMRHLHMMGGRGRLLDVGCGNGKFVKMASDLGWYAEGIDMDEIAVNHGVEQGLRLTKMNVMDVCSISHAWDVITMAHVIEHMHDPVELMRRCRGRLKPGGKLWLATPNLESLGHKYYGHYWRGLEVPRHLTIFTRQGLYGALAEAGFRNIVWLKRGLVRHRMFMASSQLMNAHESILCQWRGLKKLITSGFDAENDDAHSEEFVCLAGF